MAGFKEYVRKAIHLGAGDNQVIDAHLEVGAATQTIEVTDVAAMVNNENASIGQAITTQEVQDLPSNGGTPMMVLTFAMGVSPMSQPSQVLPFASGGAASWSISGSPNQTNELLMDGVPNATWDGRQAYSPPTRRRAGSARESIRQRCQLRPYRRRHRQSDSEERHQPGQRHGFWNNQPNNLVANDFFRNKSGLPVP